MSLFAIDNNEQAFHLTYDDKPVLSLIEERRGGVKVSVTTIWRPEVRRHVFWLVVPEVIPQPTPGDNGIHGSLVRTVPTAGRPDVHCERFCPPLLVSARAEFIAREQEPELLLRYPDFDFTWLSWYGRVNRAVTGALVKLSESRRQPTGALSQTTLQRAVSGLLSKRPGDEEAPIPLTDAALIWRHLDEVELGYPAVPGNDALYEAIKARFLTAVDPACDLLFTGKNDAGRRVLRARPDAPRNRHTGRPMARFCMAVDAMAPWANPVRDWRENGSCQWLRLTEPLGPPLKLKGVGLPQPLAERITTVTVAIVDMFERNVFQAGEGIAAQLPGVTAGQECALDALLITPTGKRKLHAQLERSELLEARDFEQQRETLERLPGYQVERHAVHVERLGDGTDLFRDEYRWSHEATRRCRYDKVKLLWGGIKAVTEPIRQLYLDVNGQEVPVDLVVAETSMWARGAVVLAAGVAAAIAGMTELDPTWSWEELLARIEAALLGRGLPVDGRFDLLVREPVWWVEGREVGAGEARTLAAWDQRVRSGSRARVVGTCMAGPAPAVRATETEVRQSDKNGAVSLNIHARLLADIPLELDPVLEARVTELAAFFETHAAIQQ